MKRVKLRTCVVNIWTISNVFFSNARFLTSLYYLNYNRILLCVSRLLIHAQMQRSHLTHSNKSTNDLNVFFFQRNERFDFSNERFNGHFMAPNDLSERFDERLKISND